MSVTFVLQLWLICLLLLVCCMSEAVLWNFMGPLVVLLGQPMGTLSH
jgi:hypothetical protein